VDTYLDIGENCGQMLLMLLWENMKKIDAVVAQITVADLTLKPCKNTSVYFIEHNATNS